MGRQGIRGWGWSAPPQKLLKTPRVPPTSLFSQQSPQQAARGEGSAPPALPGLDGGSRLRSPGSAYPSLPEEGEHPFPDFLLLRPKRRSQRGTCGREGLLPNSEPMGCQENPIAMVMGVSLATPPPTSYRAGGKGGSPQAP